MQYKINPKVKQDNTKNTLISKVTGGYTYRIMSNRNQDICGWFNEKSNMWRFIHFQKYNKKTKQVQTIQADGKNVTKSTVLRRGHWVATYYDIDHAIITNGRQDIRTFSVNFKS